MSSSQPLTVAQVRRETPDCVSISFDVSNHPEYLQFKAGQYVNLDLTIDGTAVRRSYSISSAPGSGELRIAAKAVEGGFASVYLQQVQPGQSLNVFLPEGNFGIDSNGAKHHVFFGAGSGITPLRSMISAALQNGDNRASLFFGNSGSAHTIFKQDLESLAADNPRFQLQHVWTDGTLEPRYSGRIDFSKAKELLTELPNDGLSRAYYLCGPAGMIQSVREALLDNGVSPSSIHIEYFEAPDEASAPQTAAAPQSSSSQPVDGEAQVTVVLDAAETTFSLDPDGEVILDAALDQGMDAPFSCKGGVCTTCRAKVLEGAVRMDANYALTDGEVEEGYILTCQSHPTTASVKISWDEP